MITTRGTYPWSFVAQIFCNSYSSHGFLGGRGEYTAPEILDYIAMSMLRGFENELLFKFSFLLQQFVNQCCIECIVNLALKKMKTGVIYVNVNQVRF